MTDLRAPLIDVSTSSHHVGDCRALLAQLPDGCVQTCVTSPPYWGLRDYGHAGQIGLEPTPEAFVAELVRAFAEELAKERTAQWSLGWSFAAQIAAREDES